MTFDCCIVATGISRQDADGDGLFCENSFNNRDGEDYGFLGRSTTLTNPELAPSVWGTKYDTVDEVAFKIGGERGPTAISFWTDCNPPNAASLKAIAEYMDKELHLESVNFVYYFPGNPTGYPLSTGPLIDLRPGPSVEEIERQETINQLEAKANDCGLLGLKGLLMWLPSLLAELEYLRAALKARTSDAPY